MTAFKIISIILLFIVPEFCAQTDWVKWNAAPVSYQIPALERQDYTLDRSGFGMTVLSVVRNGYYFFISDLDGDNCAFSPSCSSFYLQSVKETSIFKGTLMFADRFARDINFFKGSNKYHKLPAGKYFDPAYNYTLHSEKIKL
ncbi:MAG: hypothetical protein CVV24_13840 [Ignavibacteriae bacterium HGW-Ignavibacteriae-3]|nr:MAG: hypothetical protein CVV24_13840 [Ignavibacteriae bacterium HGW-Ignavibacteriae-3]